MAAVNLDFTAGRQDCYSFSCDGGFNPATGQAFGWLDFVDENLAFSGQAEFDLSNPISVIQTQYGWSATYGPGGGMFIYLTLANGQSYTFTGHTLSGSADISQVDQGDQWADSSASFVGSWNNGFRASGGMSFSFEEVDYFYSSGAGLGVMTTATPEPATLLLWLGLVPSAGLAAKRCLR
jgi:hypothetical protein